MFEACFVDSDEIVPNLVCFICVLCRFVASAGIEYEQMKMVFVLHVERSVALKTPLVTTCIARHFFNATHQILLNLPVTYIDLSIMNL